MAVLRACFENQSVASSQPNGRAVVDFEARLGRAVAASNPHRFGPPREHLLVEAHILPGAALPRPVLPHAGYDDAGPRLGLLVNFDRATDRLLERQRAVLVKTKAVGRSGRESFVGGAGDRVGQAAGR